MTVGSASRTASIDVGGAQRVTSARRAQRQELSFFMLGIEHAGEMFLVTQD